MILFRFVRRLTLAGLLLATMSAALGYLWYRHARDRDPMPLLDRGPVMFRVERAIPQEVKTQSGEARVFHAVTLDGGLAGRVRFTVSLPREPQGKRLATIVILGGLEIGQASLGYVPTHGNNALVAYQYPERDTPWDTGSRVGKIPEIRRAVLEVPAQVEVLLAWVAIQPWADVNRMSLMGYSFGAIFLPSVQRLAQAHDRLLGPAILAYGGAEISELLMANLDLHPRWLRRLLAEAAAVAIRPVEPALHLPHLHGRFLLINGKRDTQITPASTLRMQELTPEPKTIVWLDAGHMNPGDPLLLAEIIRLSREWMIQRNAMDP